MSILDTDCFVRLCFIVNLFKSLLLARFDMGSGKELIQSAREALDIAEGKEKPAGSYIPKNIDVAAIRKKLNLSQESFAEQFGLSVATIRDWEQHRRSPDRAALVLLAVIDKNPQAVKEAIFRD